MASRTQSPFRYLSRRQEFGVLIVEHGGRDVTAVMPGMPGSPLPPPGPATHHADGWSAGPGRRTVTRPIMKGANVFLAHLCIESIVCWGVSGSALFN